ncbi:MAG: hypothetical protein RLZ44_795 [Pseudomonadota bacterium]|jgi:two-component system invasion response regulator UvrY
MIKILLVDDHELFRTGLRSILQGMPEVEILGEASTGEDAVDWVRRNPPDIIMMDLNMPGIGGIEATRKIGRINPAVKVIAVTVLSDDPFPAQLLDAGAWGYVSKGCPAAELFDAIGAISRGEHYISSDVARKLTLSKLTGARHMAALSKLSARELQVMMMITRGQSTQDISDSLFLSPKTVSTYRHRLFEKLDVANDVELTHYALRHGLLDQGQ